MKTTVMILAALALAAVPTFGATEEAIRQAENSPGAAKFFSPCPPVRPTGPEAKQPGTLVYTKTQSSLVQHGTSFSQEEAYDFYCRQGSGGKGGK